LSSINFVGACGEDTW